MQINSNIAANSKPVKQTGNGLDIMIDREKLTEIAKIIIKDKMTISEEGKDLLKRLSDDDLLNSENIKKWENEFDYDTRPSYSKKEEIDNLFIDLALEYKNKLKDLGNLNNNEFNIQQLNEKYMNELDEKINNIADEIDGYFDMGKFLSDVYSKEPSEDLFDKDLFKDNLKSSILEVKDYIMNSDETSREEIYENFLSGQKTKSLEKMSFNDLKVLHNFINEPKKVTNLFDKYSSTLAKDIADREKELNQKINGLDLSDTVKNSMIKVNHRVSDGKLKHIAYMEERDNYKKNMEKYDKLLERLLNRISMINETLEGIKENQGISPDNKRIFKYLGMKEQLTEEYKTIKKEKDEKEKEFTYLNDNKHTIVEHDSYKKIKEQYDKEMAKE